MDVEVMNVWTPLAAPPHLSSLSTDMNVLSEHPDAHGMFLVEAY